MATIIRLLCGVGVLVALGLSVARWSFEWSEDLVVVTDRAGDRISMPVERAREVRLRDEFRELGERVAAKDRVAERLLAGEVTLPEAAAVFGQLFERAGLRTEALRAYEGSSEGEILCRQVIAWVENKLSLERSPGEATVVRQRLEAELRRLLAERGTVELPQ